jgi:hypothetical protein
MWIVALILLAVASTSASAAPLHLSCKGNVVNVLEETPEPATVLVRVENYELMQLSGERTTTFGSSPAPTKIPFGLERSIALLARLRSGLKQGC